MVVFEYFFDKMNIFGPKMDEMAAKIDRDMEEVCLPVCLLVYQSACKSILYPKPLLRNLHPSPPLLIQSLAHFSWPSVSATMPDCRTERTMKRE